MYDKIKKIKENLVAAEVQGIDKEVFLKLEKDIETYVNSIIKMLYNKDLSKMDIVNEIESDNFYHWADIMAKVDELGYINETTSEGLEPVINDLQKLENDLLWREIHD